MKKERDKRCRGRQECQKKAFLMMKLTCLFMFFLFLRTSAVTNAQVRVSLDFENANLLEIMQTIREQTGYKFFFNHNELRKIENVSAKYEDVELRQVLNEVLSKVNLTYRIEKGVIIIVPQSMQDEEKKSLTVKGWVRDEKEQPMPGVTVKVVGTSVGTAVNEKGWFSITLPMLEGTLEFSFVGYKTQRVEFSAETTDTLKITMKEDVQALDEAVVVAYGNTTRRKMTGSVSVVKGEELEGVPAANLASLLQGRVAGMDVTNISGAPGGGGTTITIRGYNSLDIELERRFSDPLWVVDGVPLNSFTSPVTGTNLLADINPDMIESIQVLKDASSAALYGSRAANGVIIVTTKKGRQNQKSSLSVNVSQTWSILPELPTVMTGRYERNFRLAALKNDMTAYLDMETLRYKYPETWEENYLHPGGVLDALMLPETSDANGLFFQDSLNAFYNNSTNFFPMYYERGKVTNANIQSYGGSEKIAYSIGLGYYDEKGILKGSGFNRIDLNSSINVIPIERLNIDLRLNASLSNRKQGYGSFSSQFQGTPAIGVVPGDPYELSSLYPGEGSAVWDYILDQMENIKEKNRSIRLRTNMKIGYEIIDGLNFSASLAADYSLNRRNGFTPSYLNTTNRSMSVGETGIDLMVLNEDLLSYEKTFKDVHDVSAILGFSYQYDQTEYNGGSGENSPSDKIYYVRPGFPDLGDEQLSPTLTRKVALQHYQSNMTEQVLISWFARVEYGYKDKYLLSASIRRDGSSTFGEHNKWGTFPAVAAAWTFSEEGFIKNTLPWISFGKIRASWGRSGKHFESPYLALGTLQNGSAFEGESTLVPSWSQGMYNQDLTWEETDQYDFGLDMDLFNYRLGITLDYYYRYTDKLLFPVSLPGEHNGYGSQWQNAAAISNEGLELLVRYDILSADNYSWRVSVNGSRVWNRYEKSYNDKDNSRGIIGKPLNGIYGYRTLGYINSQDEVPIVYNNVGMSAPLGGSKYYKPGDLKFVDVNGDNAISTSDYVYLGSALPEISGGLVSEARWRNFDLNFSMSFQCGRHIYNTLPGSSIIPNYNGLEHPILMDLRDVSFWEKPGDDTDYAKLQADSRMEFFPSNGAVIDRYIEKVNWLKLKTATLGYNLPKEYSKRLRMEQIRLFISGENLFTWSNYSGIDPEIVDIRTGIDQARNYPLARKFTIGLTLKF